MYFFLSPNSIIQQQQKWTCLSFGWALFKYLLFCSLFKDAAVVYTLLWTTVSVKAVEGVFKSLWRQYQVRNLNTPPPPSRLKRDTHRSGSDHDMIVQSMYLLRHGPRRILYNRSKSAQNKNKLTRLQMSVICHRCFVISIVSSHRVVLSSASGLCSYKIVILHY
jgi:hypothetical protein